MPWTAKDAKRFKKGLTSSQAAKWVKIANGALKACQAKKGKNCEASAIRIANSKFNQQSEEGLMEEGKLPKGALRFVDEGCHAHVEFAEGDTPTKKLRMVAYSGGIIRGHWYWNNLAIDLEGIQFKQSKFPVLEDHMTSRKIAVISKPQITDGKLMAPETAKFLSTEASEEFQKLSNEGFPYQSSIYAKPSNVERLEEGASAEVNGFTMKGPGTIWRQCEFKEMSVCVFGWDSKTQASAFSRSELEDVDYKEDKILAEGDTTAAGETNQEPLEREEVKKIMNKAELQEKHPDLYQEIVDEATSAAEAKFSKDKDQLEGQITVLKDDNTQLTERVLGLEKKDVIRAENELAQKAVNIWTSKLTESDIPDSLHGKVRQYVSHSKFVSEGKFDVEAFSTAVDAEIKDWEDKGVKSSVIGAGFSEKDVDDLEDTNAADNATVDTDVDRLVNLAGGEVPKKDE